MPDHIICVSAPEGGGKDTLIAAMLEQFPELKLGPKATTRLSRADDILHGGQSKYRYLHEADFMDEVTQGKIVEFSRNANGCLYGSYVDPASPGVEIRDIDVNGARFLAAASQWDAHFPPVTAIGVIPYPKKPQAFSPDHPIERYFRRPHNPQSVAPWIKSDVLAELDNRLARRGDSAQLTAEKLERAKWEVPLILRTWPYVVVNDHLERAISDMSRIIQQVLDDVGEAQRLAAHSG